MQQDSLRRELIASHSLMTDRVLGHVVAPRDRSGAA
jgi:hypothetical protein